MGRFCIFQIKAHPLCEGYGARSLVIGSCELSESTLAVFIMLQYILLKWGSGRGMLFSESLDLMVEDNTL